MKTPEQIQQAMDRLKEEWARNITDRQRCNLSGMMVALNWCRDAAPELTSTLDRLVAGEHVQ